MTSYLINEVNNEVNFSGGNNEKATPVPIPNTEVKLLSADDTWLETARESRSLPEIYQNLMPKAWGFVFLVCHAFATQNVVQCYF